MTISTVQSGINGSLGVVPAPNQRGIEVTAAGRIWALILNAQATGASLKYSDDGSSWTATPIGFPGAITWRTSMFLDADGYLHMVGLDPTYGFLNYVRGTPIGTDSWSWQVVNLDGQGSTHGPPTVLAHREGSGWKVHIFYDLLGAISYWRLRIDSAGGIAFDFNGNLFQTGEVGNLCVAADFSHIGDGRTVKAGAPHLYVTWVEPTTGRVMFVKIAYSAGTWSPVVGAGTPLAADNRAGGYQVAGVFDGARFLIAYLDSATSLKVLERDAADTTTTIRTPLALADGNIQIHGLACDKFGDFYLGAAGLTSGDPKVSKYTRDDDAFSVWTTIEATTIRPPISPEGGNLTLARVGDSKVRGIYATGASQPFTARYADFASTNVAPDAPPWANADNQAVDITAPLVLVSIYSDRNTGDQLARMAVRRRIGATDRWLSDLGVFDQTSEHWFDTSDPTVTLLAGWGLDADPTHVYYARHEDIGGLQSPEGPALHVVPSTKVNPDITSLPDEMTAGRTMTWDAAEQTAFKARLLVGSTQIVTSGWIPLGGPRSHHFAAVLDNAVTYTEEITTRNAEGLASDAETNDFTTAFTLPRAPTAIIQRQPRAAVTITPSNPPPFGPQPALAFNRIYRQEAGRAEVLAAASVAPGSQFVDYRIRSGVRTTWRIEAVGTNGAVSSSDALPPAIPEPPVDADSLFFFF